MCQRKESAHAYRKTGCRLHVANAADETMAFPSRNQLPDCPLCSSWLHLTRAEKGLGQGGGCKLQQVAEDGRASVLRWAALGAGSVPFLPWFRWAQVVEQQPTPCQAPPLARASPFLIRRMGIHGRDALPPRISSPSQPSIQTPDPLAFCTTSLDTRDLDPDNPEVLSHGLAELPSSIHLLSLPTASV
jgi:hypothetical protein